MKKPFLSEMTFQRVGGCGMEVQSLLVHVLLAPLKQNRKKLNAGLLLVVW